jgi:4-amino-4-deoxy-L-arabinose transferase-like glycosyltransferase
VNGTEPSEAKTGWSWPKVLLGLGLLLTLYYAGLGAVPYFQPDEGRYTEIPREMLASGDFVLPHLDGVLYFEKPPLYYWLNAAALSVFGISEFASRFWSATLGLLGLLPLYLLGKRAGSTRAGLLAAAILGTSPLYLALAHLTIIDMALSVFFTLTLACFYLASVESRPQVRRALFYGMFAAAALTVLSKGLIGIVLPGGIVFTYLLLGRRWDVLKRVPWFTGVPLFLLIAAPWHVLAAMRNPDFLWFYFVREHFLRYLTTVHDRVEPWWFFLPIVLWALLPFTALLPASLWERARPSVIRTWAFKEASPELFCWLWAAVTILFFSLSHSKLIPYILPALPPLAVLAALQLDRLLEGGRPAVATRILLIVASSLCALFGAAFVWAGAGNVRALEPSGAISVPLIAAGSACVLLGFAAAAFSWTGSWKRAVPAMILCAAASFGCIWSAAPALAESRRVDSFAAYIQSHREPGDRVVAYRYYPQALPVYLRDTIAVAAFQGELEFGISKLSAEERQARFPTAAEFLTLWNSPTRVWCVTDRGGLAKFSKDGLPAPVILQERGQVVLLTNRPLESGKP